MVGAIVLQWPIGKFSDRVSRRAVIFGVAVAGATVAATLGAMPEQSVFVPALMFALGGTMFPLYSLVVSYTLDWTPDAKLTGASSTLVRTNGSGALVGPLVTAPLMAYFGPGWFFWSIATSFGVIVAFVAYRLAFKDALPQERQKSFVPFPARAGALALDLVIEPVRKATKIASGNRQHAPPPPRRHGDIARHSSSPSGAGSHSTRPDAEE
jgi:MFS family permease